MCKSTKCQSKCKVPCSTPPDVLDIRKGMLSQGPTIKVTTIDAELDKDVETFFKWMGKPGLPLVNSETITPEYYAEGLKKGDPDLTCTEIMHSDGNPLIKVYTRDQSLEGTEPMSEETAALLEQDLKETRGYDTPPYYDNSKGSLYHIAEQRGWGVRLFDLVKRLERGGKKDPLKQELEKSIGVLQLWLKELEG